jgi:hypothetical protein
MLFGITGGLNVSHGPSAFGHSQASSINCSATVQRANFARGSSTVDGLVILAIDHAN